MSLTLITAISENNPQTTSEAHLCSVAQAARQLGIPVYSIGIENELQRIPDLNNSDVLFNGYIPQDYQLLADTIESRNGKLINSFQETELLMKFSKWYPLIKDLTAKSIILEAEEDIIKARQLTKPWFIKGEIKSSKEAGLKACLANNEADLEEALQQAKEFPLTWQNKVIVREFLKLKKKEKLTANSFPLSREYRIFLYKDNILGHGFYWQSKDSFGQLTKTEQKQINQLASQVQERLETNLTIVDLAQLEDQSWKVIEVGDPQFCLFTHLSAFVFFNQLLELAN